MAAFLSIHDIKTISASTVWRADNDCSPHFTLDFKGESFENRGAVTFYVSDAVLNTRFIEAFNRVIAERKAELEAPKCDRCDGPMHPGAVVDAYDELVCAECDQNAYEAAYERHCEDFHDGGCTRFNSLRDQQIEAMKLK